MTQAIFYLGGAMVMAGAVTGCALLWGYVGAAFGVAACGVLCIMAAPIANLAREIDKT